MSGGPAVATILVIFAIIEERLQVLLVHRDEPPEAELWALPGGLWDGGRTLEQAAQAKLFEESGARDVYLEQLFTESGLDPTQQGVAIAYFALVEAKAGRPRESAVDAWRPGWLRWTTCRRWVLQRPRDRPGRRACAGQLDYTTCLPCCRRSSRCASCRRLRGVSRAPRPRNSRKRCLRPRCRATEAAPRRRHRPARCIRFTSREPVFL